MIETIILDYLNSSLSVPVLMELPEGEDPISLVVIEKTGGSESNCLKRATFAIQSYGKTLFEAAELNEEVKNAMKNLIELSEVSKVSLNSDYNYTDKKTKRYRYQAVFDVVHY